MNALTLEQLDAYERDGFVRLDTAFPHELAARCRTRLWEQLEESPNDPATWTRPVARLPSQDGPEFRDAVASPRWLDAIGDVWSGSHAAPSSMPRSPGRTGRRATSPFMQEPVRTPAPEPWLGGTVAVRFPVAAEPGDAGWHVDGSYAGPDGRWWLNARSDGRALLMLVLLSDVGTDDAPTRLRTGSHLDVADALARFGDAGVASLDFPLPARALERPVAYATGRAGDVYLCHPFLVHAAQRHCGREPRFVAQPGVPWLTGPTRPLN